MKKCFSFFKGKALALMIASIILVLLASAFNLFQPVTLQIMINQIPSMMGQVQGITQEQIDNAWKMYWFWLIILGAITVLGLATGIASYFTASKSSLLAVQYMRDAVYGQILTYSFKEYDKVSTASIINRVTKDAQNIQMTFQMMISLLIQAILMFVGGVIISFALAANQGVVWMGGIVLALVVIMLVSSILLIRKVMPLFSQQQISFDKCASVMRQNILGVRVVKSFSLQDLQTKEYDTVNDEFRKNSSKALTWIAPLLVLIQFIMNFAIAALMLAGGLVVRSKVDSGAAQAAEEALVLSTNIYTIIQTIMAVLTAVVLGCAVLAMTVRSLPSFRRIDELFKIKGSIVDAKDAVDFDENNYDIEYKNVNFKYATEAKENVLKNLNFKIKKGETLGIIGATASGKSSLINLIPRLYDVTEGEVTIGGKNVKDIKLESLRRNIKVGIQELILFSGDIFYNVAYGKPGATELEVTEACKHACAWEFIEKIEDKLHGVVEQRGRNFSGGQKQRLCLARAIIGKPKILILDNVTSALDMITEKTVNDNINRELPDTIKIIVSQRISSIINANQIIVLENGAIESIGTHEYLIQHSPIYKQIADSQLKKE